MEQPGKTLAVAAETLFLLNLLLLPGLAFAVLLLVYLARRHSSPPLAANHLAQTTGVSVIGGALIVAGGAEIEYRVFDTWGLAAFYDAGNALDPEEAFVVETASSMRCFFSLSSTSVPAPTLMMATPPAILARRSCSFSRS